jgi:hypothetical protein
MRLQPGSHVAGLAKTLPACEERHQGSKSAHLSTTTRDDQKPGCNPSLQVFSYFVLVRVRPDAGHGIANQLATTLSGMIEDRRR